MNSGVDVPGAPTHLVEAGRLHAVLLDGPAHDGVEPDVGMRHTVDQPRLVPLIVLDHPRSSIAELGRDPTLEHVGRFHDVVVDGDERKPARATVGLRQERNGALVAPTHGELGDFDLFKIHQVTPSTCRGAAHHRL
ncbi:MAG: hypothetical protein U5L08_14705 [Xanthomonadales bacterium]|nr:hypothetical protein [Xanthomonadales bacterium]